MNKDLQSILNIIQRSAHLTDEEKNTLSKAAKSVDKELEITSFKLDRTEKVKKTTAILLEETITELEQKRKAVEAQNKELEIESSLETVRTVAMSMNKPDDMLHVCHTISDQLELLNVKEIRNVQTAIFYQEKGTYMNYEYYAKHHKTFITETTYTDHKIQQDFANKMLKGNGEFMIAHIKGDEVKDWIAYQKTTNVFIDDYLNTASSVNYYWFSLGPVALGTSTYVPLTEEETNLFKRFLKVFELSYRRYLDIEKAEIQAKEAQIENALEKVRSRSLAMHTSDELGNVVSVAFQKLKELGVGIDGGVTINILKEGTRDLMIWGAAPYLLEKVQCIFIPYFDHRILTAPWDASDKGLELFTTKYSFEEKNVFYKYVFEHTGFKNLPDEAKDFILSAPCIVQSVGLAKHSSIAIYSYEDKMFSDFENDVLKRFAKVFEQAYVRFLDLQKAEAQAKEAKIEAALERVRAQAMSIRKSEELAGVGEIIFEQLKSLGFSDLRNTEILINNDNKESIISYYYSDYGITGNVEVFYKKKPTVQLWVTELKKANDAFAAIEISENEMDAWRKYREEIGYQPDPKLNEAKTVFYYCYSTGLGALSISSFTKISDDQIKTLERFRNVFGLAYRRYADVAQAEAQAREAQIELALERVRARTMAMQKSDELAETASLLFKQLIGLGIKSTQMRTCAITTLRSDEPIGECWITKPDGDIIPRSFMVPYNETSAYKTIYAAWKNGEKFLVVNLSGDALVQHLNFLKKYAKIPTQQFQALPDQPTETFTHAMFFSQGYLFIISNEPLPEYHDIFKRFGAIFQQTYTRFLDLQKAEAQAKESLIEVALERVRARTMAMHKSSELIQTAELLFDQLKQLGAELQGVAFAICDQNSAMVQKWTSIGVFSVPYTIEPGEQRMYEAWKNQAGIYEEVYERERIKKYYELFMEIPAFKEGFQKFIESGHPIPTWQKNHAITFKYGYLLLITTKPFNESQIFLRFGKVFEQTYTRFLDLQKAEAQARESQIELGLERIRARAMAMQKSEELAELVDTVFKELTKLDLALTRCILWIMNDTSATTWMANPEINTQESFNIKYPDHPYYKALINAWKERKPKWMYELKGNEKKVLNNLLFNETEASRVPDEAKAAMMVLEKVILSFSFHNFGALQVDGLESLSDEHLDILYRFGKVFDLTYTRFSDLKQAEAQTRESQIQLALERVRARTMAMQKSDELSETVFILFQQFKQLGENPDQATIGIINEDEWVIEYWVTMYGNQMNRVFKFSIDEPDVTNKIYKGWKEQKKSLVIDLSGKELYDFATYRASKGGAAYNEAEKRRVINVAFFSKGILNVQSNESRSAESILLLERFAKVFEQTYMRFLDLKKAEAQARESQIENALERVRSRSMAMQKSEELKEVIQVVYDQFVHLNINIDHAGFVVDYVSKGDWHFWIADKNDIPSKITTPYFDSAWGNDFNNAKEKDLDFFATNLNFQEKNKFYTELLSYVPGLPEESKKFYLSCPGLAGSTVLFEDVSLYIENFSGIPYSDEENKILLRFGKVFQQTYTRFNDLKNAEAQAKEATLEAALEKVRGRAMAMQNSNDLSSTVSMVFTELRKLGINPIRSGVGLLNKESRKAQLYSATSSADGDSLALIGWVVLSWHPVLENIYEAWLKNEDYFPELIGEQLKSYYENLMSGLSLPSIPDWQSGQKQYGHFFSFSVGCLYAWSETPYNDTEIKILKRFASIIDLTFRRYLELRKSEANAREAVKQATLDRVRADIASMRTTNDLEKITPLIWNELTVLGIPFIRCGVFIMDEEQQQVQTFLYMEGKAIASFTSTFSSSKLITEALPYWRRKKIYKAHWDEAAFLEQAKSLVEQGAITTGEKYLTEHRPTDLYLHFLPFLQGMLYVGDSAPLSEEHLQLVQALADAFSTAYARYEDFNKLETAKQQVDKTLVDLKQTQTQLIQSEKMASLGELTAGIAHEIQNPLNFVNNFSEVSNELIEELQEERNKAQGTRDEQMENEILNDIKQNLEKINHHGKRADAIVKGMLQHSRSSAGEKEPTNINALADEYLRLSYQGLRAKDKSFNSAIKTDFDNSIGRINIVPPDIGRVLLNLYNNAFYAVNERFKVKGLGYEPTISISTKKSGNNISITVSDNGNGIPQKILDKIFQPFFTTKPTGQGTGLGLSLSYDIIKAHGGEIKVETKEGEGTEFIIQLPVV